MSSYTIKTKDGKVLKEWDLLPKQEEFLKSEKRYNLFSGGFGGGKTMALILKVIQLLRKHPNNLGLLGRMHYQDLLASVQSDFFKACPKVWIKQYLKTERKVIFHNGSELLFRHLDKLAEQEIRSLNLGFFAIDQAEQVTEPVYLALKGRLRREGTSQQGFMTCNPALSWLYREFKQNTKEENALFETATTDNTHLPQTYVADLMRYPEQWKQQFVYGTWDPAVMGDRNVFSLDDIKRLERGIVKEGQWTELGDVRIYKDPSKLDVLQMGVDPAEGAGGDASCISVMNTTTGEETAFWMGQLPPDILAKKAEEIADHFNMQTERKMLIVPEVNSIGAAFLNQLKKSYPTIYLRDVFLKPTKEKRQILGWKTTTSSKPLLITNYLELIRSGMLTMHTPELWEQLKTFVYTDEAKRQGMGADAGYHDDAVIANALACFFSRSQKLLLLGKAKPEREPYNPVAPSLFADFRGGYDVGADAVI